jgi:hypothetical protein
VKNPLHATWCIGTHPDWFDRVGGWFYWWIRLGKVANVNANPYDHANIHLFQYPDQDTNFHAYCDGNHYADSIANSNKNTHANHHPDAKHHTDAFDHTYTKPDAHSYTNTSGQGAGAHPGELPLWARVGLSF